MALVINKHGKIKANGDPIYEGIRVDNPDLYGFKIQGHVVYLTKADVEILHGVISTPDYVKAVLK